MRLFLLAMVFFCCADVCAAPLSKKTQQQIQDIDAQIEELEDIKRGYIAAALKHENQAERLQFEDQFVLETRRHLELAEQNREMALRVQQEIDQLKEQRMRLLRKNGKGGSLPPPGGDGLYSS